MYEFTTETIINALVAVMWAQSRKFALHRFSLESPLQATWYNNFPADSENATSLPAHIS
jgi:hypothetical protein